MAKKREDKSSTPGQGGFGSGLADALKTAGFSASASPKNVPHGDEPEAVLSSPSPPGNSRIHLRIERKGRKGKTVTILGGLGDQSEEDRKAVARKIGKALGCGAGVEGDEVVVQGDQRERVEAWLKTQNSSDKS
jgi:translation initiation factor 1